MDLVNRDKNSGMEVSYVLYTIFLIVSVDGCVKLVYLEKWQLVENIRYLYEV